MKKENSILVFQKMTLLTSPLRLLLLMCALRFTQKSPLQVRLRQAMSVHVMKKIPTFRKTMRV